MLSPHRNLLLCALSVYVTLLKPSGGDANTCDNNIPNIENAKPYGNYTPPFAVNTLIIYHCNQGYEPSEGRIFAKCKIEDNSATWELSESRCRHKTCAQPGDIQNGRRIGEDFRFGRNVTYKCYTGYELNGLATIYCNPIGEWTRSPPTCTIISCSNPPKLQNGSVTYDSTTYKSIATYSCDNSFRFIGTAERTVKRECLADETWSGSMPQCDEILCPDLPKGPDISITDPSPDKTRHPVGKNIYFKCNNQPSQITRCSDNGTWTVQPGCGEETLCPSPPPRPGITIIDIHSQGQGNKYKVGAVIAYLCQSNSNRTFAKCQSDGTWSALPGPCEEVTTASATKAPPSQPTDGIRAPCGEAPQVEHSTVTYVESQNAMYKCKTGFTLKGSAVLKCLSSGKWDATLPSCEKKFPLGLVIGIVVGVLAVIGGGIAAGVLFYKRKKSSVPPNKKKASPTDAVTMEEVQRLEKNSKPVPVTVL